MVVGNGEDLCTVETPPIHFFEDLNESRVRVKSAFFPIYLKQESFKASLYTKGDENN